LLSLAGCQLFRPDGTEETLDGPLKFVALDAISDNEPPGLLATFTFLGNPTLDEGMA